MVKHSLAYGVKPTARVFSTTPKTVRKWLGRYHQERLTEYGKIRKVNISVFGRLLFFLFLGVLCDYLLLDVGRDKLVVAEGHRVASPAAGNAF